MKIPVHIAVILDGNGRWARQRGLPRTFGHKKGAERVEELVKNARDMGVKMLTLFAFSTENWSRPRQEKDMIFSYMADFLRKKQKLLNEKNIRVRFIGRRDRIGKALLKVIGDFESVPCDDDSFIVHVALDYGGRDDIVRAAVKLGREFISGTQSPDDVDEAVFAAYLDLAQVPAPDLLIRTSGEERLSNFLLWQLAYSEFYFTSCLWPDFDAGELKKAIEEYDRRERRFGKVGPPGTKKNTRTEKTVKAGKRHA